MASSAVPAKGCETDTGSLSRRVALLRTCQRGRHEKKGSLKGRAVLRQEELAEGTVESSFCSKPGFVLETADWDEHIGVWFLALLQTVCVGLVFGEELATILSGGNVFIDFRDVFRQSKTWWVPEQSMTARSRRRATGFAWELPPHSRKVGMMRKAQMPQTFHAERSWFLTWLQQV